MARKKKADIQCTAQARAGRHPNQLELNQQTSASAEDSVTSNKNTLPPSPSHSSPTNDITPVDGPVFDDDDTWDFGFELEELDGQELIDSFEKQDTHQTNQERKILAAYDIILEPKPEKEWVVAEKNRALGYDKCSKRSQQKRTKKADRKSVV